MMRGPSAGSDAITSFAAAPLGVLGGCVLAAVIWVAGVSTGLIVAGAVAAAAVTLAVCYRVSRQPAAETSGS